MLLAYHTSPHTSQCFAYQLHTSHGLDKLNLEAGGVWYKIHRAGMLFYSLTVIAYSVYVNFFSKYLCMHKENMRLT